MLGHVAALWIMKAHEIIHKIENNKIMAAATTYLDQKIILISEVRQMKTNIIWYHLYVKSKQKIQMNLFTEQKQTHRHRKQIYGYQRRKLEG